MKKKILIGSIIAVVVLIAVSFTSVVGYSSVKSNSAINSPLFSVRTNRAIGEESKVLTCKYVGKGHTLPFPERDDKAIMVQKVVENIKQMDDETFEKFVTSIINYAHKDNRFNGEKPDKIREALNIIRYSEKSIPLFDADTKQLVSYGPGFPCPFTEGVCPVTVGYGLKGFLACILLVVAGNTARSEA